MAISREKNLFPAPGFKPSDQFTMLGANAINKNRVKCLFEVDTLQSVMRLYFFNRHQLYATSGVNLLRYAAFSSQDWLPFVAVALVKSKLERPDPSDPKKQVLSKSGPDKIYRWCQRVARYRALFYPG